MKQIKDLPVLVRRYPLTESKCQAQWYLGDEVWKTSGALDASGAQQSQQPKPEVSYTSLHTGF